MLQIDPSNTEWRINYSTLMKPEFLKKMLVFQGFEFNLNEQDQKNDKNSDNYSIFTLLKKILANFCAKFTKIQPNFMTEFTKCFDDGIHYCNLNTALCLYYFFSMHQSIHSSLKVKELSLNDNNKFISDLNSIADLVFKIQAPLFPFEGTSLSQFDVPLMYFAKRAAKIKEKVVITDDISTILSYQDEIHFFEINVQNGIIKLIPSVNVTCSPDFIIQIKRNKRYENISDRTRSKEEKQENEEENENEEYNDAEVQEEEENGIIEEENDDDFKDSDSGSDNNTRKASNKVDYEQVNVNGNDPD